MSTWMVILGACSPADPTTDGRATVTQVVDGDTIDVRIGGRDERVRLIGIDTPETKKPNTPIECYGPEASAFTASILPAGTQVRLERDVVGRDDYGRLLAYVHLTEASGPTDTFVNRRIIAARIRGAADHRAEHRPRRRIRRERRPRRSGRPGPLGRLLTRGPVSPQFGPRVR